MTFSKLLNQQNLRETMDLLDSILGSMDKPPSLSEREREKAKSEFLELLGRSRVVKYS